MASAIEFMGWMIHVWEWCDGKRNRQQRKISHGSGEIIVIHVVIASQAGKLLTKARWRQKAKKKCERAGKKRLNEKWNTKMPTHNVHTHTHSLIILCSTCTCFVDASTKLYTVYGVVFRPVFYPNFERTKNLPTKYLVNFVDKLCRHSACWRLAGDGSTVLTHFASAGIWCVPVYVGKACAGPTTKQHAIAGEKRQQKRRKAITFKLGRLLIFHLTFSAFLFSWRSSLTY